MDKLKFNKPEYFINKELSMLEFNNRVLEEAKDENNPLFERLKFLSIVSSNLDELTMIRIAGLKDQVLAGYDKEDPSGLNPKQQLKSISIRMHEIVDDQHNLLTKSIFNLLENSGIHIIDKDSLTPAQEKFTKEYFDKNIYPVLTPMVVDSSRPFPLIFNKTLNIGILVKPLKSNYYKSKHMLEDDNDYVFATVQVPSMLPRLIKLPTNEFNIDDDVNHRYFMFLEEIIMMYVPCLFLGCEIICMYPYRITRNADLGIEEEESGDLLREIEKSLRMRKWARAIRLEVNHKMDKKLVKILRKSLEIHNKDIYYINGPLDLTFFIKLYSDKEYEHLKYPKYEAQIPQDLFTEEDIFDVISSKDVLLHHPYESFDPVVEFVRKAAQDPNVLAIKQTLYRVSGNSPIVKTLSEAAERGKQVTVLLELKARFDEENNIQWAKRLEEAGCHVIYGLVGLKVHCKIILVVRREEEGIKRYVHLSTGNYNDDTAKLYTDIGMFTSNEYFGADASAIFNMLSGYSNLPELNKLIVAPLGLREKFLGMIENEINNVQNGQKAYIIAKMNSLVDTQIIDTLYRASQAGVKIDLIVRGICCLRPNIPNISDNIRIYSIVGRFLEHSRIYYFYNGGREDIFLSSADWMPRNLNRRIEALFPVQDKNIKKRIKDMLNIMLSDNVKARICDINGKYKKVEPGENELINSQEYFCKIAVDSVKKYKENKPAIEIKPKNNDL